MSDEAPPLPPEAFTKKKRRRRRWKPDSVNEQSIRLLRISHIEIKRLEIAQDSGPLSEEDREWWAKLMATVRAFAKDLHAAKKRGEKDAAAGGKGAP